MTDKPLEGIRVLDLTQIYQGPYAAFLMAMAGAEVIKVEPRAGERLRGAGGSKTPMAFAMLNSNKKSITLDLKQARGKELLKDLVAKADVLLENFAPGTMDRLEVGWEVLKEINPRLVYVSGTGYGLSGPDRDLLAMDHTIQAASGIMSSTGDADRPPARAGGAPSDIMGGSQMYAGTLTALLGRVRTGKGTLVEVSMLESMYFTLSSELTYLHTFGKAPERSSARSPSSACPYGRYQCKDGWIAIINVSEGHWQSILRVIGRDDLLDDPELSSPGKRKKVEDRVNNLIETWSRNLTQDEAYNLMRDQRIPVAPVREVDQVRDDPHLHERGMLQHMSHPDMGDIVLPNSPIRFSDYDSSEITFFPEVGANNSEVYGEWLGLQAEEIDLLAGEQVI